MRSPARAATPAACLEGYKPEPRRYDELLDERGALRPHWQRLLERLGGADLGGTVRRGFELTQRLIAENGVTYNVYADPLGADRPWTLDPLPLLLTAAEWRQIEQGVAQRARLLDALLADLYGPQRLLAEGVVPPELPFGHPNYLLPCQGSRPRDGTYLHLYAADLARAPDGRWWVLADRTQAPSGAGYALENREIMERVLPDALRDLDIRRVHGFFEQLRERLPALLGEQETPLAVVLTPGPYNETYFEQAYLARQLGWPLAEGSDLTVREDTVYLKTLAGLKRVHAILRRLDDDFCDPLELRSGSALGVPGLLGAVRAGRVLLANALGSGVLESAAWLGFLPGIAERLLGERLLLPSVATWWCGEAPALAQVLASLDHLVIKPTYPNQRFEPVFGRDLRGRARLELIERLQSRPSVYVAQEHLALSQGPVLRTDAGSGFAAKALTIRVYALAVGAARVVMPGGLARVATDAALDVVSSQRGGGSKDIWVLAERRAPEQRSGSLQRPEAPRRQQDLPSRLVENLYWFGRYTVRCEDKARLLRGTLGARIDAGVLESAVGFCRELGIVRGELDAAAALRDEANPQSIGADVRRLAWCASQVRSRLSESYWHAVAQLQRQVHGTPTPHEEPLETLEQVLLLLAALAGFALDDMTQDAGWRLLRIGRRLERLQFISRLLGRHLSSPAATDPAHIEWLLEACDSLRVYRPRYTVAPRLAPLIDLLVRDAEHPRALGFQWHAITRDLTALSGFLGGGEEHLAVRCPALDDAQLLELEQETPAGDAARAALRAQLASLSAAAAQLSDRLSMRHFAHSQLHAHALAS